MLTPTKNMPFATIRVYESSLPAPKRQGRKLLRGVERKEYQSPSINDGLWPSTGKHDYLCSGDGNIGFIHKFYRLSKEPTYLSGIIDIGLGLLPIGDIREPIFSLDNIQVCRKEYYFNKQFAEGWIRPFVGNYDNGR
jgi:hypothetical protein